MCEDRYGRTGCAHTAQRRHAECRSAPNRGSPPETWGQPRSTSDAAIQNHRTPPVFGHVPATTTPIDAAAADQPTRLVGASTATSSTSSPDLPRFDASGLVPGRRRSPVLVPRGSGHKPWTCGCSRRVWIPRYRRSTYDRRHAAPRPPFDAERGIGGRVESDGTSKGGSAGGDSGIEGVDGSGEKPASVDVPSPGACRGSGSSRRR